ncbi:MAG: hypothetical protein ACTSR1_00555 [Candidatus Heimdallarchaeota archaeon]
MKYREIMEKAQEIEKMKVNTISGKLIRIKVYNTNIVVDSDYVVSFIKKESLIDITIKTPYDDVYTLSISQFGVIV